MTSNPVLPDPSKILVSNDDCKRELATNLAAAGFNVIPLPPDQKAPPLIREWQNQSPPDPTKVYAAWTGPESEPTKHNVGLITGGGFLVLDFDRKKGGGESYLNLTVLEDKLPATFTVRTRDGGYHVYLSCDSPLPSGTDVLDQLNLPGVDLRASNGYVVAPGSTVNGRSYQVINTSPIAKAPQWLIDALGHRRQIAKSNQQPVAELDSDQGINMAIQWLSSEAEEAVEGAGGDSATYRVCVKLRDFAISEPLALNLLLEHWNETKAIPPWSPDELEKKVAHAYRYGTATPGIEIARQPTSEFPPLPESLIKALEERPKPASLLDRPETPDPRLSVAPIEWRACEGEPPPLEWIWQDLIPKGHVTTLFGDGGTGKTLLAQQLATIMAAPSLERDGLFGHRVAPGNVVALFCEDDAAEIWRRQQKINRALGLSMRDLDRFTAFSGYGEDNLLVTFDQNTSKPTAAIEHLRAACDRTSPSLVIIDNIADTFGGDEIRRVHVNQFLKTYLGGIARDHGCAVLLLGHPSNAGLASGSGISGSRAWSNGVRSRLFLRRIDEEDPNPDPNARVLELMKANYAPTGTWFRVKWQDGVWAFEMGAAAGGVSAGTGEPADRTSIVLSAVKRLISEGHDLSPNDRAGNSALKLLPRTEGVAELRMGKEALARVVDRLMRDGEIHIEDYRAKNRQWRQRYALGPRKETESE